MTTGDYRWHRLARLWRTPVVGELVQHATNAGVARWLLRPDNPGLPDEWVDRIAGHAVPKGTKRAVLRLYRSTDRKDLEALSDPLRQRDPDTLVVWGADDAYLPVEQAGRQRRAFPARESKSCPVSVTGPGSNSPIGSLSSSSRSCANGPANQPMLNHQPPQGDPDEHNTEHRPRTIRHARRPAGRRPGGNGQPAGVQKPRGLERYLQYGQEVAPHLERVGATI